MDEEPLVRAMPRRPLYTVKGLVTRIDLEVLTAIEDEGWFATRTAIAADVDCKEVALAVLVLRGGEALADAAGRIAHCADIGPERVGLAGVRALARETAEKALAAAPLSVELAGYLNDDAHPELRHRLHLVYRARAAPAAAAPAGLAWLPTGAIAGGDPLSASLAALVA